QDRKPVDPPPIIQLRISHAQDPHQNYLQSMIGCDIRSNRVPGSRHNRVISSPFKRHRQFRWRVFHLGDLSIKMEGTFRLKFTLFEMRDSEYSFISEIVSEPFTVHSPKHFLGMSESTFLTRSFSDQGVRLRLRKEPR
ncbi:velvet factor-domain-containing protein, partial [Halenospora varia]